MEKAGCRRKNLAAKIVGGANMFSDIVQSAVPIGLRNVSAVRQKLEELGIPIEAEEVGGTKGRTMIFTLEDGRVEIRRLNQPEQFL
jgi:chemotaxis protein CheD